jgi:hypothetical protein
VASYDRTNTVTVVLDEKEASLKWLSLERLSLLLSLAAISGFPGKAFFDDHLSSFSGVGGEADFSSLLRMEISFVGL